MLYVTAQPLLLYPRQGRSQRRIHAVDRSAGTHSLLSHRKSHTEAHRAATGCLISRGRILDNMAVQSFNNNRGKRRKYIFAPLPLFIVFSDVNFKHPGMICPIALVSLMGPDGKAYLIGNSIKKASKGREENRRKLASGWNVRKVSRCKTFSTSTPKPRAEGSIPSAPAIQRSETIWFRSFFGTFLVSYFE